MFECALKKKSSSCRLLLLFISCSLKVAQRQRSLPTQTSEGHIKKKFKKKRERDDQYSFEISADLAYLQQDHEFQAQYLYTKQRKKPSQVSFHSREFSLSSSITIPFCALTDTGSQICIWDRATSYTRLPFAVIQTEISHKENLYYKLLFCS